MPADLPFPRVIWMYWHQGLEAAPDLVRACVESWKRLNPGWRVEVLDSSALDGLSPLGGSVDLGRDDIEVQKVSNLLRLQLLATTGGVWADATTFCTVPLDEWLPDHAGSGFFAFRDPGPDRLVSTWFLAAAKDNELLVELYRRYAAQYRPRRFWFRHTGLGRWMVRRLTPVLGANVGRTRIWLSFPLRRVLRLHPYFLFHYVFNDLVGRGGRPAAIWDATPSLDAGPPHLLQRLARRPDGIERALAAIRRGDLAPVMKLDWRVDAAGGYWSAVLDAMAGRSEPDVGSQSRPC